MERLEREEDRPKNPRQAAGPLSALTFWWLVPIVCRWRTEHKTSQALPEWRVLDRHRSEVLGDALERAWERQLRLARPSLAAALFAVFGRDVMICGLAFGFLELIVKMSQPLAVGFLVGTRDETTLRTSSVVLVVSAVASVFIYFPTLMGLCHCALKMKIALASLVFRKSLRLRGAGGSTLSGRVVSLLTADVGRIDLLVLFGHNLWIGPLVTVAAGAVIWTRLGAAALVGLFLVLLSIPFQAWLTKISANVHRRAARKTDERLGLMNDIVRGIRSIKSYAWELPFSRMLSAIRSEEIRYVRRAAYIKGVHIAFQTFRSRTAVLVGAAAHLLAYGTFDVESAFVLTACFQVMKRTMTDLFSYAIEQVFLTKVALKRLHEFLVLEESPAVHSLRPRPVSATTLSAGPRIEFDSACVRVTENGRRLLTDVNLTLTGRGTTALVGPVGSGKTLLLMMVLREVEPSSGRVSIDGRVSYAGQEPWLFDGSLRQNVLLDGPTDEQRYRAVLRACDLERDIGPWPAGDRTPVGDAGSALSGGQRARVALARALYRDADVYLLDDPLASLDAAVADRVFDGVKELMRDRLCVFVTTRRRFAISCDAVVRVADGCASFIDPFTLATLPCDEGEELAEEDISISPGKIQLEKSSTNNNGEGVAENGLVAGETYAEYIRALGGRATTIGLVASFAIAQAAASGSDYFLARWASGNGNDTGSGLLYVGLVVATTASTVASTFVSFRAGSRAAARLHERMYGSVASARLEWFEARDAGRVLNRFSRDVQQIDETIPSAAVNALQASLAVVGAVCLVAVVQPWTLLLAAAGGAALWFVRGWYVRVGNDLRRIEASSRGPMLRHTTAVLNGGLVTARAFGLCPRLATESDQLQDPFSTARYLVQATARMFAMWMEAASVLMLVAVVVGFALVGSEADGADVGLAVTQVMSTLGLVQWALRQSTELEGGMTAVERTLEYCRIEDESCEPVAPTRPPPDWPSRGRIVLENVAVRHGDRPSLLGVDAVIEPGEKIGLIGRTGAGKTSIASAILRLYHYEGHIWLDGVDISTVDVRLLRSRLSIITQSPTLFGGRSVRFNLDPTGGRDDRQLWSALQAVGIADVVSHLDVTLAVGDATAGFNLSVGQKQLLCLARAILTDAKVLIMDEATANLDMETDRIVQETIRTTFSPCTVVTITHRLEHALACDRVLVLTDGRLVEEGPPRELLARPGGYLASLNG